MSRERKEKWAVCGEYGGNFTNLKDAKQCAKEASKTPEHDYEASVTLIEEGAHYIDYKNGKCTRDGWTIKHK
ncbi:hypothetical protein SAMN05443270_3057 [Lacrimispora sphenoides]|uniref:hypothetical protein n=1 Tax=Lacrimispora sphenoides TaxID=29370 RepID=UPI0008AF74E8|nr:hypothetical protein [Lacrimispora sphenoides]SEU09019.1 hypothetical protein SAMN05443270_3057 [Lacrimispora sphenoides]